MRLFLAVSPDEAARNRIDALHIQVERTVGDAAPALRWVAPAVAHLTVHFLGEIETTRVAPLVAALESTVPVEAFDLTLGAPEVSPRKGPPRVIWMPVVSGVEPLTQVHRRLGERLARAGVPIEPRPFAPHLTIARVREREHRRSRLLGPRLHDLRVPSIGWRVDHVTLFRSDLSGPTPKYDALHTIVLGSSR